LEGFKNFLLYAFIFVLLIFGGIAVKVLLFPVHVADKSVDLAYATTDKTMTAENAIYNYEWFKEQEAYIRQCLKNEEIAKEEYDMYIKTLPENREKWDSRDKDEEASLRNSYYALQKLTNKAMEDYNAKSSMVNRVIFKDNLPSNIDRAFLSGNKLTK
jgi:acyl-CoA synthetase (AMP-forming)/AMP-acid ligase II